MLETQVNQGLRVAPRLLGALRVGQHLCEALGQCTLLATRGQSVGQGALGAGFHSSMGTTGDSW